MRLDEFDFFLPEALIAQYPSPRRDDSRLMLLDRSSGRIATAYTPDIPAFLQAGDLLVVNDTRVRAARLFGVKESGGRVELLLISRQPGSEEIWSCLTRASKPLRPESVLHFSAALSATVLGPDPQGVQRVRFSCAGNFPQLLEEIGHIPLPPYIRRADEAIDRERYQTVFASAPGAVAAPTAGLHFTPELLARLKAQGVEVVPLTLHVGIGTFTPVRVERLAEHRMHSESYEVSADTADAVNRAKEEGRRVIAVGTTSTRALEAAANDEGRIIAGSGETDIFITPGYRFRVIDGLLTNFHLPASTLLVLVSAFAGHALTMSAYRQAVEERFRFFSYGDCMLIL